MFSGLRRCVSVTAVARPAPFGLTLSARFGAGLARPALAVAPGAATQQVRTFKASAPARGLEEFFTLQRPGKTGRSWRATELRCKSYEDLRKLWFVLMKEQNMLYTYKELARRQRVPMENLERFHKTKVSMARIKTVLNERKHAYLTKTDPNWLKARLVLREQKRDERQRKKPHRPPKPVRFFGLHKLRKKLKFTNSNTKARLAGENSDVPRVSAGEGAAQRAE